MTSAIPEKQSPNEKPEGGANPGTEKAKPIGAGKPKTKKTEAPTEPLPDEPQSAPELPKSERSKADYDTQSIIAGDGDDDEYSDAAPVIPKLVDKLPKAKYIRIRGGKGAQTQLYTIRLDEEDQRPGELNSYILTKAMRDFFVNELQYKVIKQNVCDVCTIQGQQFLFMYPAASDLSANSWNITRARMLEAAKHEWIIISSDMEIREYTWRSRKANLPPVTPRFPTEPIAERAVKAVQGARLIGSQDHPIVRRLLGIVESGEAEAEMEGDEAQDE
jgi:hypothetical protein